MKLDITNKVDLSYLGEKWSGCFLEFRLPTVREVKESFGIKKEDSEASIEFGIKMLKSLFVTGKVLSGGELVEVSGDDIDEFPMNLITECLKAVNGELSPK